MSHTTALRITPTANPDSFFITEQEKAAGKWGNAKGSHAIPVYITKKTTVFELMEIISGTRT